MTHWVLLGSPFLGPEVWEPVAEVLGDGTVIAGRGADPQAVLASYVAAWPERDDVTLVPHSNAGLYVAALADRARRVVFVDALLPGRGATTPVTSPTLAEALAPTADDDGLLPPWTSWWPDEDVSAVLPDVATRARVEAGQPRVPAAYLSGQVPTPSGWDRLPCAYVGFGDAYAEEAEAARTAGWPVRSLPGGHLHQLVDPVGVAEAIGSVLD